MPSLIAGVLSLWVVSGARAQEQVGLRFDRYSPLAASTLNPARAAHAYPLRWELRLGAAQLFAANDYFHLRPASTLALWQARQDLRIYALPDIGDENKLPEGAFLLDFFQKTRPFQGRLSAAVAGPGLWLRLGERHTLGVTVAARAWIQAWRVPAQLGYYTFDRNPVGTSIPLTPFEATAQSWREWAVQYSFSWEGSHGDHALGLQLKWLRGYESAWFDLPQPIDLVRLLGDTVQAPAAATVSGGYTEALWNGPEAMFQRPNGQGLAFDLGYTQTLAGRGDPWAIQWGISLLDIGAIRYEGEVAWHRVRLDSVRYYARGNYASINSVDDIPGLIQQFSYETMGDSMASYQGNTYRLWLPAALSTQADVAITSWAYVGAAAVLPLPFGKTGSRRNALLTLIPRLEHRWASLSTPVVWYNWQELRVGLAARLGFVTIGTDHLGSWIRQRTYTGTDLYLSISLTPFLQGIQWAGRKRKPSYLRGRSRGKVRCYEF